MIKFLSANWIGSLIGIASILISIIVSYYFYRKSINKSIPSFQRKSFKIIDIINKVVLDDIEITYKGRKINRLVKSYIIFWNDGNKTIDGKDILEKDKLRVVFQNNKIGEILSAKIISRTRDVNEFDVKLNPESNKEIVIGFNFLDKKDGAIIEILHTFNGSLNVLGTIKGIPQGIKDIGVFSNVPNRRGKKKNKSSIDYIYSFISSNVFFSIYIVFGIFFLYSGFFYDSLPTFLVSHSESADKILFIFGGFVCILPLSILKITFT